MNKAKRFLAPLLAMLLVLTPFSGVIGADNNSNEPALRTTVTPSNETIVKPADGPAEGNLNIDVTPTGVASAERGPIEVVFVMDTSGSMDYASGKYYTVEEYCTGIDMGFLGCWFGEWSTEKEYTRLEVAIDALGSVTGAGSVFSSTNNNKDKYSFVTFADNHTTRVNKVQKPEEIKTYLDNNRDKLKANGGTYYAKALKAANGLLNGDNQKYILFLTDGAPSDSNDKINAEVNSLVAKGIKLYSIGFGTGSDVDVNYLKQISEKTGGKAEQSDSDKLESIYKEFGEVITSAKLTNAQLKVKLPTNVDTTLDKENGYAIVNIADEIPFEPGKPAPTLDPSKFNLPLEFSKAGEYIFDDIQLVYKDVKGVEKPVKYPEEVKITVVESISAQFTGTVSYEDPDKVGALEKIGTENSDSNQFNVIYDIVPFGGTGSGKFENITIRQPLPQGITLKNEVITDKYTAKQISEESSNFVEITYPSTEISYSNLPIDYDPNGAHKQDACVKVNNNPNWRVKLEKCGNVVKSNDVVQVTYREGNGTKAISIDKNSTKFQNIPGEPILVQVLSGMPDTNVQIPLQADYAVETNLPAAEVIFDHTSTYDHSNQKDLKSTLTAPEETIKMVVKLYGSNHTFIGDHNGVFDVKDNSGKDVPIKITNEAGVEISQPAYAVKSMEFVEGKNEKQVKVIYFNDEIAYINLNIVNLEFNEKVYIIQGKEQLSLYDFKPQDPGDSAPYSSASDFTWQIVSGDTSLIDGSISADGKIKGKQVSDDESDYVTVRATLKTDSSVSAETKVYVSSGLSNIDFAESNYKIKKDDNEQLSLSGLENAIINGDVTAESSSPSIVDITTSTNNYIDVNGKGAGVSTVKAKAKGTEVIVNAAGNVSITDNKEVSDTTIVTVTLELPKPDKSKEKEW